MISAFGVDHGGISKASKPGLLARITGHTPRPRGPNGKVLNQQQIRTSQGTPGPSPKQKVQAKAHAAGEADISAKGIGRKAASGMSHVSRFVEEHPGTAGVATLGAGGAGIYGVARGAESRRQKKS